MVNLIGAALGGLLLALAAACPAQHDRQAAALAGGAPGQTCVQGTLAWQAGALAYTAAPDTPAQPVPATGALPYQIVYTGQPALITTCAAELSPVTYAIGAASEITAYPGWVPQLAQGTLIALTPIADSVVGNGLGVQLLGTGGGVLYRNDAAVLLAPAGGAACATAYILEAGAPDDLIFPFGDAPRLMAVDTGSGECLWTTGLQPAAPAADAQLWAILDGQLLLSLQYDYELFEFLVLSRSDGTVLKRTQLKGIPAGANVYPGPVFDPQPPEISGPRARLAVYNDQAGAWQRWEFDCAAGTLEQQDCAPPVTLREENAHPVEGAGTPGPDGAPFPQRLLPAAAGAVWSIGALTDGAGRVLVVDSAGARWIAVEDPR